MAIVDNFKDDTPDNKRFINLIKFVRPSIFVFVELIVECFHNFDSSSN